MSFKQAYAAEVDEVIDKHFFTPKIMHQNLTFSLAQQALDSLALPQARRRAASQIHSRLLETRWIKQDLVTGHQLEIPQIRRFFLKTSRLMREELRRRGERMTKTTREGMITCEKTMREAIPAMEKNHSVRISSPFLINLLDYAEAIYLKQLERALNANTKVDYYAEFCKKVFEGERIADTKIKEYLIALEKLKGGD